MICHLDIENSKTQKVVTYNLNIIEYVENKHIKIDISNLSKEELSLLSLAISKNNKYCDIELFFIDDSNYPEFGPDYDFKIEKNILIGKYIRGEYETNRNNS